EIKRVSLRSGPRTLVPVTFIAQAPGELTISDWRVAFEIQKPEAPPVPERGLCTATPPDRQPGETPSDCCRCSCCEKEQKMADPVWMVTGAGRLVLVGGSPIGGVEMLTFGGQPVLGPPPFSLRPIPGLHPVVLEPVMMRLAETSRKTARPTAGPATLRDISF